MNPIIMILNDRWIHIGTTALMAISVVEPSPVALAALDQETKAPHQPPTHQNCVVHGAVCGGTGLDMGSTRLDTGDTRLDLL